MVEKKEPKINYLFYNVLVDLNVLYEYNEVFP